MRGPTVVQDIAPRPPRRQVPKDTQGPHPTQDSAQDRLGAQNAFEAEMTQQDDGWTALACAVERMFGFGTSAPVSPPQSAPHPAGFHDTATPDRPGARRSTPTAVDHPVDTTPAPDTAPTGKPSLREAEGFVAEAPDAAVPRHSDIPETETPTIPHVAAGPVRAAPSAAPAQTPPGRSARAIASGFSGRVRQRAQAMPEPEISVEQQQQTALIAIGMAGRARSQEIEKAAPREAITQVAQPPKQTEPAPAPVPENPIPKHTQKIKALSNKRLPNQPAKGLQRSDVITVEGLRIGGSLPRLLDIPVAPDLFNALTATADIRALASSPTTIQGTQQLQAAMRTLTTTDEQAAEFAKNMASMGRAPAVIAPDAGALPAPPLPAAERTPVRQVIAHLLAQEDQTVAGILDNLRSMAFPGGILKARFPDIGAEMATDLQTSVRADLHDVAAAADISAEDLNQAVAMRKSQLAQDGQQARQDLAVVRDEATQETQESGQTGLDAIECAAEAAREETLRRQEKATGGVDPQVINRRRDHTVSWIHSHVTREITGYQTVGDKRLAELRRAKTEQTNGYNALAQREVYQVLRPSDPRLARDPNDNARENLLAGYATQIRAGARTQTAAVATHFDRDIRISRDSTQTYRRNIEAAGTAGKQAARQWAEDKILEGESWWTRLKAKITRWLHEADDVNEHWRVSKTTQLRDNIGRDLDVTAKLAEAIATGLSEKEILQSQAISDEQKFVIAQYFALEGRPHPLTFAALSIKFQLAQSHRPGARAIFERDLLATPINGKDDPVLDDLVAVSSSEGNSFDPRAITAGVRAAMRGWGTDEARIYRSLANLNALQGNIVRKLYQVRYGCDLDSELDSELSGDEMDRAQQLLAGDQAAANATALHYAIAGMGTDEDAIMATLRSKSPEEIAAIRAAYRDQFGETLDDALKADLAKGHEMDQANALLASNTSLADAISVDKAMRGGMFGWGASASEVEAVQTRIREEAIAMSQQEGWSARQLEQEVQRRLREMEGQFEEKYGDVAQYNQPGLHGDTALRRAFGTEFRGAELDLVNGLQDNNLVAADAARIEIERLGFYASDDRINTILQNQYERSLAAARLDLGPVQRLRADREFHRRVGALPPSRRTDSVELSRIRMALERESEAVIEREAAARSRMSMNELDQLYSDEYIWPLSFVVDYHTSGDANARAVALLASGGRMDPLQEIEIASAAGDGPSALGRLTTMTKTEIDVVAANWERRHPGRSFESMLRASFSGRDQSDIVDIYKHGRPTTALETISQERRRVDREMNDLSGEYGDWAAGEEASWARAEMTRLERLQTELQNPVPDTEEGRLKSLDLLGRVDRQAGNVRAAVNDHRQQLDSVTNVVSQAIGVAIALVVAVVVTALTLGTGAGAGIAIAAAIIGSVMATGATIGTKQLIKGGAYGRNELNTDLVVGAVDVVVSVATLGIGSRILGPVMRGASGAAGLVRAAGSGATRLIGKAGSRLAASGAGRVATGAASRMAGSGLARSAQRGLSSVGRSALRAGQRAKGGLVDLGSGIANRGRGAMAAIGRRAPARARAVGTGLRELGRETIEQVPTSRQALKAAGANTLEQGIEDAVAAVPSALTGLAMSDEAWKGDPLENFASGAWDAILQGVVMGRVMGGALHMGTPVIRRGRVPLMRNIAKVGEVSSYLNARFTPFAQRNPGASMADFMGSDSGRRAMAEVRRRGLMDALVDLSRAGPPRTADTDMASGTQGREHANGLAEAIPKHMQDGTFVTPDPALSGRSVDVTPLRIGDQIVGVDIRVGPDASPLDIALHLPTVRTMRRYRGLLGQVRSTLDGLAIALTGQGQQMGRRGWAAQAEIEKLPAVIAARMNDVAGGRLTPEAEARVQREIDGLHGQLRAHRAVLNDTALSGMDGDDVVSARDDGRRRQTYQEATALKQALRDRISLRDSARKAAFSKRERNELAHIDRLAGPDVDDRVRISQADKRAKVAESDRFANQPDKIALWFRIEEAEAFVSRILSDAQHTDASTTGEFSPEALAQLAEIRRLLDTFVADPTYGILALLHLPGPRGGHRRRGQIESVLGKAINELRAADTQRQTRHAQLQDLTDGQLSSGFAAHSSSSLAAMGNFVPTHTLADGALVDPRLPHRHGKNTTHGVVDTPAGSIFFKSGEAGPGMAYLPSHAQVAANYSASHVEGHVAALMVAQGIKKMTVIINHEKGPCGTCSGGTLSSVGNILPVGYTLTVRFMTESGRMDSIQIEGHRKIVTTP